MEINLLTALGVAFAVVSMLCAVIIIAHIENFPVDRLGRLLLYIVAIPSLLLIIILSGVYRVLDAIYNIPIRRGNKKS